MSRLALTAFASAWLLAGPVLAAHGPVAAPDGATVQMPADVVLADCPGKKHVNA